MLLQGTQRRRDWFPFKDLNRQGQHGAERPLSFFMEMTTMATKLDKVLYTAKAHTTGGRDGRSASDDGLLEVRLAVPKVMGGKGDATNPEQLFAAGYSACFMGALRHVAGARKLPIPQDASIDASVSLGPIPQ